MTESPGLTVVLRVDRRRERGERALSSLLAQSAVGRMEVLVYDFAAGICPALPGSSHPAVTVVPVPLHSTIGTIRLDAFQRAHGPIVGFLEEHAIASPGWAEALLGRFESGNWVGAGPEVANLRPGALSDTLHALNFPQAAAPALAGPALYLPGNNSAYRREVVLALGDDLPILLEAEPLLNRRLVSRGYVLGIEPGARIRHAGEQKLMGFMEASYAYSRMFGGYRSTIECWSVSRVFLYVILTPLIPFVRVSRLLAQTALRRPEIFGSLVRGCGYLMASSFVSALGQSVGLLYGPGRSREHFLSLEMNAPRDFPPV